MYQTLTFYHSIFRWLVLISLVYAIFRAYRGYRTGREFSKADNSVRHWTATITHVQLMLGILVYSQSPVVSYFWKHLSVAIKNIDAAFFGLVHMILMLTAIVVITIGSALAKRKSGSGEKFKIMWMWFGIGLIIIFIAIPWPFSPLAHRPYFR